MEIIMLKPSPIKEPKLPKELVILLDHWTAILSSTTLVQNNIRTLATHSHTLCAGSIELARSLDTILGENGYFALFLDSVDQSYGEGYRKKTLTHLDKQDKSDPIKLIELGQFVMKLGISTRLNPHDLYDFYMELIKQSLLYIEKMEAYITHSLNSLVTTFEQYQRHTKIPYSTYTNFTTQELSLWVSAGIDLFVFAIDKPETMSLIKPRVHPLAAMARPDITKALVLGLTVWMFQNTAAENPLLLSFILLLSLACCSKFTENRHRLGLFSHAQSTDHTMQAACSACYEIR
jgi:hypothetical protein